MSTVINGLGSSVKMHRADKAAAMRGIEREMKAFRKELKKARKSPSNCKVAARQLSEVFYQAGIAFASMRGAGRKTVVTKRASGAGVKRAVKARQSFDKACLSVKAHKKAVKKAAGKKKAPKKK